MTCLECLRRAELLEQAEATLRDKRREHLHSSMLTWIRVVSPLFHQLAQARENVEHHRAVCTEEKR